MSKSIPTVNDVRIASPLTALDKEVIRCLTSMDDISDKDLAKVRKEADRYKRARALMVRAVTTMQGYAP